MTRILIGISDFFVAYWPLMLAVAARRGVLGFRRLDRARRAGRYAWDRFKLRMPVAGQIILKATLARFARSFALVAARAACPIVQALTVVASVVDNAYLARRIEQMRDGVERGESVLRTAVPRPACSRRWCCR